MSPSSESSEVTVRLPADLHARPAGQLALAAARFRSTVTLAAGDRQIDARSVLLVMSLGATAGTDVTVRAQGEDAEDATATVADLLRSVQPEGASAST